MGRGNHIKHRLVTGSKCDQHFLRSNRLEWNLVGLLDQVIFKRSKSLIAVSLLGQTADNKQMCQIHLEQTFKVENLC